MPTVTCHLNRLDRRDSFETRASAEGASHRSTKNHRARPSASAPDGRRPSCQRAHRAAATTQPLDPAARGATSGFRPIYGRTRMPSEQVRQLARPAQCDTVACGDLVATMPSRSATTRRMNVGGKNRSSLQTMNFVGTASPGGVPKRSERRFRSRFGGERGASDTVERKPPSGSGPAAPRQEIPTAPVAGEGDRLHGTAFGSKAPLPLT